MAFERREFAGAAVKTTLSADITSGSTSFSIGSTAGWPTGSIGKFLIAIDRGTPTEEKMFVQSRSGSTLTLSSVADRGAENTTAQDHSAGAPIEHVAGATDADEANYTVSQTVGKVTTKGDLPVAIAAGTFTRQGVGANNTVLVYDSAQTTGMKGALVDQNMLATSTAGNGLSGGGGSPYSVNVDNATVEIAADTLRTKDAGITPAKLAASLPRGYLNHAIVSSSQLGITTQVDLTGFTVTFTPVTATRIVKLEFQVPVLYGTGGFSSIGIFLYEGATLLDQHLYNRTWDTNGRDSLESFFLLVNPTLAAHTYKLRGATTASSFGVEATATQLGAIVATDIGGT